MVEHIVPKSAVVDPKISVCIANYNGVHVIEGCIRSLLSQDFEGSFEIIVHDDGSIDDSVAIIRNQFDMVNLLISDSNVGYCASNNRMVDIARGEFILLLNNDAELFIGALTALYAHATKNKNLGVLTLPQFDYESGQLIDKGMLLDPFLNPIHNTSSEVVELGTCMGACFWIRKSLWVDLGGFPTWFESMAEDMYVCCVVRLWGYSVEVTNESGYRHKVGHSFGGGKVSDTGLNTSMRRRILSERNKTFVMAICYPLQAAIVIMPVHLMLLIIEGILLAALKRKFSLLPDIYFNCIAQLWINRTRVIGTRAQIQKYGSVSNARFFRPVKWRPHKLFLLLKYGLPRIRG